MEQLRAMTGNYIINVGATAWILAQVLKTLFTLISTRKFVVERLFGAGGMPSSHSALTISIAIAMARKLGFASPEFGLALAFAGIVMYDAMGVRRAAGEQAKVLNRIVFEFPLPFFQKLRQEQKQDEIAVPENPSTAEKDTEIDTVPFLDKELKEFLGHTPLEVFGGVLLGILVAVFMPVV
jgi:acid phosphatase family membrane protein YuiD